MNEKQIKTIKEQQKKFNDSLRKDKEVWQGLYSFGVAYTKEFDELFTYDKNVSK